MNHSLRRAMLNIGRGSKWYKWGDLIACLSIGVVIALTLYTIFIGG